MNPSQYLRPRSATLISATVILGLALPPLVWLLAADQAPAGARLDAARQAALDAPPLAMLGRTLAVALTTCLFATLIALPAAVVAARAAQPMRNLILLSGLAPLALPPFVGAALLLHALDSLALAVPGLDLDPASVRGSPAVLSAVLAWHLFPLVLFGLSLGLRAASPGLVDSAHGLGASRLQTWRLVRLPLAAPAFAVCLGLLVLRVFEDVGAARLLGVDDMLAVGLLQRIEEGGSSDPLGGVLAMVLFALSLAVVILAWPRPQPQAAAHAGLERQPGNPGWRVLESLTLLLLVLIGLGPVLWLLRLALPQLDAGLSGLPGAGLPHGLAYAALTGLACALLVLPFLRVGRSGGMPLPARLLAGILLVIPGLVLALAYRTFAAQLGLSGQAAVFAAWIGLAMAVALKLLPLLILLAAARPVYGVQAMLDSLRGLPHGSRFARMRQLVGPWPLPLAGVVLLGCAAALSELTMALVLAPPGGGPPAPALFGQLAAANPLPQAAAAALLLTGTTLASLLSGALLLLHAARRARLIEAHHD